jgi:beta-glucosidase
MKHIFSFFAAAAAALILAACASEPEVVSTLNTPVPGAEQDFGYQRVTTPELSRNYVQRIQEKTAQAEREGKDIKFVMVGDSITHFWENAGRNVMEANFAQYHPLNLGFAGDRTQNILYVIEKTDIFSKIDPKLVMLLIGVNNFGWSQGGPIATAEGIRRCVLAIQEKAPNAKILLLGIFPAGNTPNDQNRPKIAATNEIIKDFADNRNVFYEDLGPKFLTPTGILERDIMGDYLHPTEKGYIIWADAIKPYVEKYCK